MREKALKCDNCGGVGLHNGQEDGYDPECWGELLITEDMACCGLKELHGLEKLLTVEDVREIVKHERGQHGLLIATAIPSQKRRAELLVKGGFKKVWVFKNPNTKRMVTVYMREVRK